MSFSLPFSHRIRDGSGIKREREREKDREKEPERDRERTENKRENKIGISHWFAKFLRAKILKYQINSTVIF